MDRRAFLRGAGVAALAATLPVPALGGSIPIIYGDGIHDDTAGFQAALDGRRFYSFGNKVRRIRGIVVVNGGTYRHPSPLLLGSSGAAVIGGR